VIARLPTQNGGLDVVEFKHGKICYLIVPSRDPQRSSEFYRTLFGWNIRTNDEGGLSFDDSTGQVSGTWVTDRPPASEHNLEVHIMVQDLDAVIAAIREAGGTVDPDDVHTDGERWSVFTDLDGNRLGIYQQPGLGN
jgi:predicted enzyme related to lactoylglutathione lyase